ncbi:MAG: hypothetical protein WD969_01680 [Paracoccaceae bacterium]
MVADFRRRCELGFRPGLNTRGRACQSGIHDDPAKKKGHDAELHVRRYEPTGHFFAANAGQFDEWEAPLSRDSGLSGGGLHLPELTPAKIAGDVGHAGLGSGPRDPDGRDEEAHAALLLGEDMLDG